MTAPGQSCLRDTKVPPRAPSCRDEAGLPDFSRDKHESPGWRTCARHEVECGRLIESCGACLAAVQAAFRSVSSGGKLHSTAIPSGS